MLLNAPHICVALATLLLCTFTNSSPTATGLSATLAEINATQSKYNFNCPEDCHCSVPAEAHTLFLHAKCSSIDGLKSESNLKATLPIHSIDLSQLGLVRLSHALEKLNDLTSIDLSHNELHEIGHLGRRIKKLNLKGNRLTSGKLAKLPAHVQKLNLQHNDITYLPLEFTKLKHLQTLELSHNNINCSCETLDVRNWLQEHHVFMEHAVVCSYPVEVKGKPWLQIKQSDICEKEQRGYYADDDENELMLGDEPVEGSADLDDEDELGKDFMPIDQMPKTSALKSDDVEGSGDLSLMNMPLDLAPSTASAVEEKKEIEAEPTTIAPEADDDDDGSGSGGGLLIVPHIPQDRTALDDFDGPDHVDDDNVDNKPVEQPTSEDTPSPDIFGAGMGIFDDDEREDKNAEPVEEDVIVPQVLTNLGSEQPTEVKETANTEAAVLASAPAADDDDDAKAAVVHAEVGKQEEDSSATYFLLGVIVLIVVGLIFYVGIKRCKHNNHAHDAENPRQTELLDMDKKNLGKPVQRNGNESSPLIGEKTKSDFAKPINGANKKPYDSNDVKDGVGQQPLLDKNGTNGTSVADDEHIPKIEAPVNEQAPHEYFPITPRYPTPKSPRASKYAQHAQTEPNNNNSTEDAYMPSSPINQGRYSPVYSPETGRVKIKLTETPRPKTPMLVTRSKSNAGEIITTPVHQAVPINAGANGQVVH